MGVKGGVVVWCLLLAGLLLLAVTCTAERDTEKEKEEEIRWCKKDCDWKAGEDTGKARECKEQCERRRHGHELLLQEDGDSFDRCVSKCRGHGGWWGKERWDRCRQICRQSQEGEGGDDDTDEGGHNADDRCERMCQHYHDRREKKQCMKGCRYGESVLIAFDDGREHGDRCQTQCKRFRPGSYDRQQCVEKCQCQQKEGEEAMNLNHHGGGGHGHGDRCQAQCKRFRPGSYDRWQCTERCRSHQQDEEEEEVMNHHGGGGHGHGGSSCEQKCQQRYRHEYDKQQCVRDCKSGGGGGAGGRGREGDERQHDTGMVVEGILEDV